jgi:glycerophosphoryl diester phosphodiesterase
MEIYGHRGAKVIVMENSLHGFLLATEHGVDRFELDIRLSADNQLVVVHDERLKRLENSPLRVSQTPASTLANTHLIGLEQGIPTLEQVIAACPNVKHWQFEIKTEFTNPSFIQPLERLITEYKLENKVVITSKHIGTLKAFKHLLPDISRGYVQEWPIPNGIKVAQKLKCSMLVINKNLAKQRYIKKAQTEGLHVSIWTVNDADRMSLFLKYGANSIISDYPQAARAVITPLSNKTTP